MSRQVTTNSSSFKLKNTEVGLGIDDNDQFGASAIQRYVIKAKTDAFGGLSAELNGAIVAYHATIGVNESSGQDLWGSESDIVVNNSALQIYTVDVQSEAINALGEDLTVRARIYGDSLINQTGTGNYDNNFTAIQDRPIDCLNSQSSSHYAKNAFAGLGDMRLFVDSKMGNANVGATIGYAAAADFNGTAQGADYSVYVDMPFGEQARGFIGYREGKTNNANPEETTMVEVSSVFNGVRGSLSYADIAGANNAAGNDRDEVLLKLSSSLDGARGVNEVGFAYRNVDDNTANEEKSFTLGLRGVGYTAVIADSTDYNCSANVLNDNTTYQIVYSFN
jgi:hypothetical protein